MADHAGERRPSIPSEGRDIVASSTTAPPSAAGRSVMVTIGIDRYRHWRALDNAVGDATGAAALFERLGFAHVVPPLLDDRATGAAIEALVTDELTGLGADDSLIVFYAGHGGMRPQRVGERDVRTGYLIPVDAAEDPQRVQSWIELDPWLRRISRLPPRHILVILDACFSGIALSSAVKWGRDSGALTALPFAAANERPSRLIITSALDDERAMDSGPVPGHSLFTGCLIEALTGGVAPVGMRDGRHVTIGSELGRYVRHRVQTYPGRPGWQQTPDFGTFDFDERGEMLIPLLVGDELATLPPPLARGSADRIAPPPAAGCDPSAIPASPSLEAAIAAPAIDVAPPPGGATAATNAQRATAAVGVVRLMKPSPATTDAPHGGSRHLPSAQPTRTRRSRSRWYVAIGASLLALAAALASIATRGDGAVAGATPRISSGETAPRRDRDGAGGSPPVAARTVEPGGAATAPAADSEDTAHDPGTSPHPIVSDADRTRGSAPITSGATAAATPPLGPRPEGGSPEPSPSIPAPAARRADGVPGSEPSSTAAGGGRTQGSSASPASELSPPVSPDEGRAMAATQSVPNVDRGRAPQASKPRRRAADPAASLAVAPAPAAAAAITAPGGICMTTIDAGKDASVVWKGVTIPATTPLPLPCGEEISLEIHAPGHVTEVGKITAVSNHSRIKKRLRRAEFQVRVDSVPQGARVWVGTRSFGSTPVWIPLPVGKSSTLKLTKAGYEDKIQKVTQADDGLRLGVELKRIGATDDAPPPSPPSP